MITTRTRILSILATVAMLVSMLACFVIPASAEESVTAPYAALVEDVPGATSLAAVIETATDETTLSNALQEDVTAGRITWPTWAYGSEDYPRYAYKAVYEAAGYPGTEWSITEPADWLAMVTDSNAATNPATFDGYTFHVTDNIDFSDVASKSNPMAPLSNNGTNSASSYPFMGIIEGYGHAFQNVYVSFTYSGTTAKTHTVGLIDEFGAGAKINNFGVEGGTIEGINNNGHMWAGTFGDPITKDVDAEDYPQLNNVWSSATIKSSVNSGKKAGASGILGGGGTNSYVVINGAYFFGKLDGNSTYHYGIGYQVKLGKAYNVLCNPETKVTVMYEEANTGVINSYGVNIAPWSGEATTYGQNGKVTSAEEGAWKINNANVTAPAAEGVAKVYFTKTENGIRPTDVDTNRIVKLSVNGKEKYINNGTKVEKADLAGMLEKPVEAIVGVTDANDAAVTFPYTMSGDATFTADINEDALVTDAWGKYAALLDEEKENEPEKYLTDESFAELNRVAGIVADGNTSASDKLEAIEGLNLKTYEEYDAAEGKQIPGYALVDTYGDFNEDDVWAINTTADWLKMVEDSEYTGDGTVGEGIPVFKPFEGHTFHVLRNIDFKDVENLKPLCFGTGINDNVVGAFRGTIEGHGHGFQNVEINVNLTNSSKIYTVGLIGKLSGLARINEFGVDSGTINVTGSAKNAAASTFGEIMSLEDGTANKAYYGVDGSVTKLNKVWSGMNLKAETSGNNYAAGLLAYSYGSKVEINGGYFYGTLDADNNYGMYHMLRSGEIMNNILSAPTPGEGKTITAVYPLYSTSTFTLRNNISVGSTPAPLYVDNGGIATTAVQENNGTAASAEEGAYLINSKQPAEDGVYFTKTENGVRFGNADNRIVKYATIANGEAADPIYANAGAAVDVAALLPKGAALVSVANNEEPIDAVDGKYLITGDVTVSYTITEDEQIINNLKAQLADKITEIETLKANDKFDAKYFKAPGEGQIGMDAWLTLAESDVKDDLEAAANHLTNETLFIEINGADNYENVPAYKDHDVFEKYQPKTGANWLIVDKDDWYKMEETAENTAANSKYFEGHTFHLIDDVDFEQTGGTTDSAQNDINVTVMRPLGSKVDDGEKIYFAGTINGHGFGFENVYVRTFSKSDANEASGHYDANKSMDTAGLISAIVNAKFVDFGINSGTISGGSANNAGNASTFGCVYNYNAVDNAVEYVAPQFTRVWSGATIRIESHGHMNALVGTYNQNNAIIVDGFTFYGSMAKNIDNARNMAYGVYGGNRYAPADGSTFKNILTYPTLNIEKDSVPASADGEKYTSAIFGFSSEEAYNANAANMSNVYGIGFDKAYRGIAKVGDVNNDLNSAEGRVFYDDPNILITGKTAKQKAYEMNEAAATTGVYFKLAADGGIRPTDTATNKIVKVNVNGVEGVEAIYINVNQGYTKAEVAKALGKKAADITGITAGENATYTEDKLTVSADNATITVTTCDHPVEQRSYTYLGNGGHSTTCGACLQVIDGRNDCKGTVEAVVDAINGKAHKVETCDLCKNAETTYCPDAQLEVNTEDCTKNSTWKFTCDCHKDTKEEKPNSGKAEHSFPEGWTTDEANTNKQYKKCENCETKMYQYVGVLQGGKIEVKATKDGEYVIELPANLASATLTFTMTGDYTYEVTEGATPVEGDVYTVAGTTNVTVKVTALLTANGGKLTVAMTDAKAVAEEGSYGEILMNYSAAVIEIIHDPDEGDANGDGKVNLQDALAALYICVQKEGAADINVANVDTNGNAKVDIEEVYAIVRAWLSEIVGKV